MADDTVRMGAGLRQLSLATRARDEISEVKSTYHRLSICLDFLEGAVPSVEAPYEKAALVVLEEDIHALLEECEDVFLTGDVQARVIESIHCRSETVIDELRSMFVRH